MAALQILESLEKTWDKRFKAKHYSYRESHTVSTSVLSELAALAQAISDLTAGLTSTAVLYVFGTNARATINPYTLALPTPQSYGLTAWPTNCYAREVLVLCEQNAWVKIVSLNPEYLKQAICEAFTDEAPTAPMFIFEKEQYIMAGNFFRFNPTYGYAIVFRADTAVGTLHVWVEGNVEGGE